MTCYLKEKLIVFVDNKHVVTISSGTLTCYGKTSFGTFYKNVGYTIMFINLVFDSCASTHEVSSKLRLLVSGLQ